MSVVGEDAVEFLARVKNSWEAGTYFSKMSVTLSIFLPFFLEEFKIPSKSKYLTAFKGYLKEHATCDVK